MAAAAARYRASIHRANVKSRISAASGGIRRSAARSQLLPLLMGMSMRQSYLEKFTASTPLVAASTGCMTPMRKSGRQRLLLTVRFTSAPVAD